MSSRATLTALLGAEVGGSASEDRRVGLSLRGKAAADTSGKLAEEVRIARRRGRHRADGRANDPRK